MYIIKLTTWYPDEGRCRSSYLKQISPLLTFSTRWQEAKQYKRKKDALADIAVARQGKRNRNNEYEIIKI